MENYFNYFTEIEEHFQRVRGTGTFRLSTLDWALIETWKESGIPLEAVLRGIDRAFEKWQARPRRGRMVNSLAYCAQEVMAAAQEQAAGAEQRPGKTSEAPFSHAEMAENFARLASAVRPHFPEIAVSLDALKTAAAAGAPLDLEEIERRLTVLEDKIFSLLITSASEEALLAVRRQMDLSLQPYRRKMAAEQIAMLEKQFQRKALFESAGLPRLSMFHW